MIKTFRSKDTETLFNDGIILKFRTIERSARRKLLYLNRAKTLEDLPRLPGNQLEALRGDRKGQYSIRINDRWRLCFIWLNGNAYEVEIIDYH